jgi:tetratricopeptide (TPR) repeat protein
MRASRPILLLIGLGAILLGLAGVAMLEAGADRSAAASAPATTLDATASPAVPPGDGSAVDSTASLDERVAFWEARVAASATDYSSTIALIDAYLDRVRTTGDLTDLGRAENALARARALAPIGDVALLLREGQVAFTLHQFATARDAAAEALARDPGNEVAVALLGDASLELGDDVAARDAYAQLTPLDDTAPVLVRLARYDLLTGEVEAAEAKMRAAIGAAEVRGFADEIAGCRLQLAELLRGENRVDEAAEAYELVLAAVPDHVRALGGLARVREAQGRRTEAIELLERAATRLPAPDLVADLGDLYALEGRDEAAAASYALVERIAEVAQATGGVYDRQLVLFLADHDRRIGKAVMLAEAELAARTDVHGYDALAWALYRDGRLAEADAAARQAMRLGTPDGRILYHAGLIAMALDRPGEARDLLSRAAEHEPALPPLQVPELRAALDALGG